MSRLESLALALFFLMAAGVAFVGYAAVGSSVHGWYAHLVNAEWAPPIPIFIGVWALIYLLVGFSGWLTWRRWEETGSDEFRLAMTFYGIQMILNGAWFITFFDLRLPLLALGDMALLLLFIVVTIRDFRRIEPVAARLMLPYFLWTTYVGALNAAIIYLNPE
jgi:tryptophan-rich sensory protein